MGEAIKHVIDPETPFSKIRPELSRILTLENGEPWSHNNADLGNLDDSSQCFFNHSSVVCICDGCLEKVNACMNEASSHPEVFTGAEEALFKAKLKCAGQALNYLTGAIKVE